jgi:hypothetical protein
MRRGLLIGFVLGVLWAGLFCLGPLAILLDEQEATS